MTQLPLLRAAESTTKSRTKLRRRIGCAVAALGCVVASSAAAAPAAHASAGAYCGTYGAGYTQQTVWIKQPPGCRDFNITWVKWSGHYRGAYYNGSQWVWCSAAAVYRVGGENWDQVACTNVATGTYLEVIRTDTSSTNQGWSVHVNY